MEALKLVPYIFLMLAIAGIIAGASMISIHEFGESMDKCEWSNTTWNTTSKFCANSTRLNETCLVSTPNCPGASAEYLATLNVTSGLADVAEQFPTIGIIAVMVVIISLIAGIFVYMKWFS